MSEIVVKQCLPSIDAFNMLRTAVGWSAVDNSVLTISFENTLYGVSLEADGQIIGFGRIIGDGLYFYIQDVIVHPKHQGQGLGKILMQNLMDYLKANCPLNSFIGLMAAKGKDLFYEKFGFIPRPNEQYGPGMFMLWKG